MRWRCTLEAREVQAVDADRESPPGVTWSRYSTTSLMGAITRSMEPAQRKFPGRACYDAAMGQREKIVRRGRVTVKDEGKTYEGTYEIIGSRHPLIKVSLLFVGSKVTQVGGMEEEALAHLLLSELVAQKKGRS